VFDHHLSKYSYKLYQCLFCGAIKEIEIGTNHYGMCYTSCAFCHRATSKWECLENKPAEWAELFPIRKKLMKGGDNL